MTEGIRQRQVLRRGAGGRSADRDQAPGGITYALMTIANLIARNTTQRTLASTSLSLNAWRILRFVAEGAGRSAVDAVETLAMDKTTVSRAVEELRAAGLIRLSVNRDDRRQMLIASSASGRLLYSRIHPVDREVDLSFEAELTAREKAVLVPILAKLGGHARRLVGSDSPNTESQRIGRIEQPRQRSGSRT